MKPIGQHPQMFALSMFLKIDLLNQDICLFGLLNDFNFLKNQNNRAGLVYQTKFKIIVFLTTLTLVSLTSKIHNLDIGCNIK